MTAFGSAAQELIDDVVAYEEAFAGCDVDHRAWARNALRFAHLRAEAHDKGAAAWLSPGFLASSATRLGNLFRGAYVERAKLIHLAASLDRIRARPRMAPENSYLEAIRRAFGTGKKGQGSPQPGVFVAVISAREYSIVEDLLARRTRGELGRAAAVVAVALPSQEVARFVPRRPLHAEPNGFTIVPFDERSNLPRSLDLFAAKSASLVEGVKRMQSAMKVAAKAGRHLSMSGLRDHALALDLLGGAAIKEAYQAVLEAARRPEAQLARAIADGKLAEAIRIADMLKSDAAAGSDIVARHVWLGVGAWLRGLVGHRSDPAEWMATDDAQRAAHASDEGAPGHRAARLAEICRRGESLYAFYHGDREAICQERRIQALRSELLQMADNGSTRVEELPLIADKLLQLSEGQRVARREPDIRFWLPPPLPEEGEDPPRWMRDFRCLGGTPARFAFPGSIVQALYDQWSSNVAKRAGGPDVKKEATVRNLGQGILRFELTDHGGGFNPRKIDRLRRKGGGLAELYRSGWFSEVWICSRREGETFSRRLFPEPSTGGRGGDPSPPVTAPLPNGTVFVFDATCMVEQLGAPSGEDVELTGKVLLPNRSRARVLLIDDSEEHRGEVERWLRGLAAEVDVYPEVLESGKAWDAVVVHANQGTSGRTGFGLEPAAAVLALLGSTAKGGGRAESELARMRTMGEGARGGAPIVIVTGGDASEVKPFLGGFARHPRLARWNAQALVKTSGWTDVLSPTGHLTGMLVEYADVRDGFHSLKNFVSQVANRLSESPPDPSGVRRYMEDEGRIAAVTESATLCLPQGVGAPLVAALERFRKEPGDESSEELRLAVLEAEREVERCP